MITQLDSETGRDTNSTTSVVEELEKFSSDSPVQSRLVEILENDFNIEYEVVELYGNQIKYHDQ